MFAGLKNKIKEETGSDVAKLAPMLSSPPQKGTGATNKVGRHSRQGSGSSVGSISLDGVREDGATSPTSLSRRDSVDVKLAEGKVLSLKEIKRLEKREDDWRRALQKREEEWKRQMEKQEEEWKKELEAKETEWKRSLELLEKEKSVLEEEKREVVKQKLSLEEALKVAEEYKKKVYQYQEDMDQLEGFQTQEMAKIKHLLLVMEQEVTEKTDALKEVTSQMESLKLEVNRLRRYEEELSNVQNLAEEEMEKAKESQAERDRRIAELERECIDLKVAVEDGKTTNTSQQVEIVALQEKLAQGEERVAELLVEINQERSEKDVAQLRCAELNQQCELVRQQLREQQRDSADTQARVSTLQKELEAKDKVLESKANEIQELLNRVQALEVIEYDKSTAEKQEQELRKTIVELEEQIVEKNKSVRVLQQRLGDMKKTLQRELRNPSHDTGEAVDVVPTGQAVAQGTGPGPGPGPGAGAGGRQLPPPVGCEDDVNFKYLKHVLIKFLTSREYEAQHLTRAVATLLRFTPEEERLLRETLEWKMSWFGTRPSLGYGQMAKTIPPS